MAGHTKIGNARERGRLRRKAHIRKRISGTPERPRLSVFRSLKHIYAQAIDDTTNTIVAATSDLALAKDGGDADGAKLKKREKAFAVGEALGKKLLEKNVTRVVFDRNGYIYHGRVKEVAEGARKAGLQF